MRQGAVDADDPANFFFAERGATVGAVFLTVRAPQVGLEWELWYQRPDELLGYILIDTKPGNTRILPQTWRKTEVAGSNPVAPTCEGDIHRKG
jgi:hypothetical protein